MAKPPEKPKRGEEQQNQAGEKRLDRVDAHPRQFGGRKPSVYDVAGRWRAPHVHAGGKRPGIRQRADQFLALAEMQVGPTQRQAQQGPERQCRGQQTQAADVAPAVQQPACAAAERGDKKGENTVVDHRVELCSEIACHGQPVDRPRPTQQLAHVHQGQGQPVKLQELRLWHDAECVGIEGQHEAGR